MTYELACWLAAKLDIFDLKVRGGKTKRGRENNDLYYSSGWAHGYKQAQADARKASRGPRMTAPETPVRVVHSKSEQKRLMALGVECTLEPQVSTLCAICDQIKELHPNTHEWTAKETKGEICQHGFVRADNTCGPCSEGRPNRT